MVVHISMFYLKDPSMRGQMVEALENVKDPTILKNLVGTHLFPVIQGQGPDFADVVQIIAFANEADAAAYPTGRAHMELVAVTDELISHVGGIDFECDEI